MWADTDKVKRLLKEKDTRNLYWCHEKGYDWGLFVVSTSRGRAKDFYRAETETDFCDVRCELHKKNIGDIKEGIVEPFDVKTLEKLGVAYYEEDDYE